MKLNMMKLLIFEMESDMCASEIGEVLLMNRGVNFVNSNMTILNFFKMDMLGL